MARWSKTTNIPRPIASSQRQGPYPPPENSLVHTQTIPVLETVIPGDENVIIKMNKYKYIDVSLIADQVEHPTWNQLAEVVKMYNEEIQHKTEQDENFDSSGKSHLSRRSFFDRIGDKVELRHA